MHTLYVFWKYFLPVCGLSFGFLNKFFHRVKNFNFIKSTLSIIYLLLIDFWCCVFKTHHQTQGHVDFLLFFKKINLFIYLFLAALGLRCCMWVFTSCAERGLLVIAIRGLLIAVSSLVVEHGL